MIWYLYMFIYMNSIYRYGCGSKFLDPAMVGQRRKTFCDLFQAFLSYLHITSSNSLIFFGDEAETESLKFQFIAAWAGQYWGSWVQDLCQVQKWQIRNNEQTTLFLSSRVWDVDTVCWDVASLPLSLGDTGSMLKMFHPAAFILRPSRGRWSQLPSCHGCSERQR